MPPITSTGGMTFTGGILVVNDEAQSPLQLAFRTGPNVANVSNRNISIGLSGTVSCVIDWGDGTSNTVTSTGLANKTYELANTDYTVSISGICTGISNVGANSTLRQRLRRVDSWGTVQLANIAGAFTNANNLSNVPNILPSNVTNLASTFNGASTFNDANVANWNVSMVNNMSSLFNAATAFNSNIANWNVGNVSNMASIFNSSGFNQPIGNWNVSKVTTFDNAFRSTSAFNQPIGNWNVSNVTNMANMFASATAFNQDLATWCVVNLSEPVTFTNASSALSAANVPLWRTCPTLTPTSNITFVGSSTNSTGGTISWPAHQAGDVLVLIGYNGNNTLINASPNPTGFIAGLGGQDNFLRSFYYIAANGSMPSVTATDSRVAIGLLYRGANATTPVSITAGSTAIVGSTNTTTISYPANPYWFNDSWVIGIAGHTRSDGNIQIAPSGLTLRANVTNATANVVLGAFDSADIFGKWTATTVNIGGTNGNYKASTIRLLPPLS